MRSCEQMPGLSTWGHGTQVARRYAELIAHLQILQDPERGAQIDPPDLPGWRLPSWARDHAACLLSGQVDFAAAQTYQQWHDCGKPATLVFDEAGRRHFPGHAQASAATWRHLGGDETTAELIEHDMDAHLLPAADLDAFAAMPIAPTLLLTALAEIHANAPMFGGIESVGFKSKWKHLDRRGSALCQRWVRQQPFKLLEP